MLNPIALSSESKHLYVLSYNYFVTVELPLMTYYSAMRIVNYFRTILQIWQRNIWAKNHRGGDRSQFKSIQFSAPMECPQTPTVKKVADLCFNAMKCQWFDPGLMVWFGRHINSTLIIKVKQCLKRLRQS